MLSYSGQDGSVDIICIDVSECIFSQDTSAVFKIDDITNSISSIDSSIDIICICGEIQYSITPEHGHVFHDIPVGLINGVNTEFVFSTVFRSATMKFFKNGILLSSSELTEYPFDKKVILTNAPVSGDIIWGCYVIRSA